MVRGGHLSASKDGAWRAPRFDTLSANGLLAALLVCLLIPWPVASAPLSHETVANAHVPPPPPAHILPLPKQVAWLPQPFLITPQTIIVVGDSAAAEDLYAARDLNEELTERFGGPRPVRRAREVSSPRGHILIGEPALNAWVHRMAAREGLNVTAGAPGPEGYALLVAPEAVVVAGRDRRGTYYGVQTLRQLLYRDQRGRTAARGARIRDWPDHRFRGVHILLDDYSDVLHVRLIERVLARFKINHVIAEAEYVQWESGRAVWKPDARGATKEQVRRVLRAARARHIEVTPLIQTLGHSEWVFQGLRSAELRRDLTYIPRRLREEAARTGKAPVISEPSIYDPTKRITVDGRTATLYDLLIFPILEEALALFRPRAVHIGHDEVRLSGMRYDLDLYLDDVAALHRFLRARGAGVMMWGDVLDERREELKREPRYRGLSRDITVVDWKYEDQVRYPSLQYLRAEGFPVIGATWHRIFNNAAFSHDAKRVGAAGMLRTTWTGYFGNRGVLERQFAQIYTYLAAADFFWNARPPAAAALPSHADLAARFVDAWRGPGARAAVPGTLVDLSAVATRSHLDENGEGWLGKGREYDLRALGSGRQRLRGVLFRILDGRAGARSVVMLKGERDAAAALPPRVRIAVGRRAAQIVFLHATLDAPGGWPQAGFGERVGQYVVHYDDGTSAAINLEYGLNIAQWLGDPEGIASIHQEVAWMGKTVAGNEVRLGVLRWTNPAPGKAVAAIEAISTGGRASPVLLAVTLLEAVP
ncbi:MAG: hypothetical protein HY660_12880 [Armatimonadetes bacterium]|nr:hypothetical protein [Armatimonadota bacterium]